MKVFLIILAIVFVVMFFLSWAQKGNDIKDGAASGGFCVIVLIVGAFMVLSLLGSLKQCASESPSEDYYDAPRK